MGNLCATKQDEDAKDSEVKAKGGKGSKTAAPRAKMSYERAIPSSHGRAKAEASRDPKDYEAMNLEDQVWVRMPGQINDQRITIEGCKNCQFFLMDQADSVQIDDCFDCTFFIGPTMGSVFIRSCQNLTVAAACSQLRLRDVKASRFSLFCTGRPVLENCSGIGVQCYHVHQYFQLREQFAAAKLSTFNNMYSMVHDFTPKANNFHYIPSSAEPLVGRLSVAAPNFILQEEEDAMATDVVVPNTHGVQPHPHADVTLVIFFPGHLEEAQVLVEAATKDESALIIHTREHNFIPDDVSATFDVANVALAEAQRSAFRNGPCICLLVAVAPSAAYLPKGYPHDEGVLYKGSGAEAQQLSHTIFEKLPLAAGFGSSV